jgi:2,4-diaminopentanoate dehydrogenase
VYSPAKTGLHAGELIDRSATGAQTTDDNARILAADADLVLRAASKAGVTDISPSR